MAKKKKVAKATNGAHPPTPAPAPQQALMLAPQPFQQPLQQMVQAPNTINASQFAVSGAPQEILLTFGHTRIPIDMTTGNPTGMTREWLMTVSMSPTSLKQLTDTLKETVAGYEKRFGMIPVDETVTKAVATSIRAGWKNLQVALPAPPKKGK